MGLDRETSDALYRVACQFVTEQGFFTDDEVEELDMFLFDLFETLNSNFHIRVK